MKSKMRNAFTLIEILIVVVIMAILAATIIPQFTASTEDAEISTAEFNLATMRAQIELFKAQHGGTPPALDTMNNTITELKDGKPHKGKPFGPYVAAIPANTITGKADVIAGSNPIVVGDITTGNGGGWVYTAATGEIRLDHTDHWEK